MILMNILEEHLEEADFLWEQRRNVVRAKHSNLIELAKGEGRLAAHLDALAVDRNHILSLIPPLALNNRLTLIFVATVLALQSGNESQIDDLIIVGSTPIEVSEGVISALGWIPFPQVRGVLEKLLCSESLSLRRIAIAGFAVHRQDPGKALSEAIAADEPLLKARALKAVGELGRMDLLPAVKAHFSDENGTCRFASAWSAALLGDAGAIPVLRSFAEQGGVDAEDAVDLTLGLMDTHSALAWQRSLINTNETRRMAVIAAGVIGDPELIPWLIDLMTIRELARLAGEAFTMITGADVASQGLEGKKPEGIEGRSPEEDADENMEMDADEELPWPNPESVQKWWGTHRNEFPTGVRHLLGKPITEAWLWHVLKIGKQRQRAAAAIELAMLNPGQPLFNVKAPAFRQMELLASMKTS